MLRADVFTRVIQPCFRSSARLGLPSSRQGFFKLAKSRVFVQGVSLAGGRSGGAPAWEGWLARGRRIDPNAKCGSRILLGFKLTPLTAAGNLPSSPRVRLGGVAERRMAVRLAQLSGDFAEAVHVKGGLPVEKGPPAWQRAGFVHNKRRRHHQQHPIAPPTPPTPRDTGLRPEGGDCRSHCGDARGVPAAVQTTDGRRAASSEAEAQEIEAHPHENQSGSARGGSSDSGRRSGWGRRSGGGNDYGSAPRSITRTRYCAIPP